MTTLRLLRNISTLLLLGAAISAARAATDPKVCFIKTGHTNCIVATDGSCTDDKCRPGQPCANIGCVPKTGFNFGF